MIPSEDVDDVTLLALTNLAGTGVPQRQLTASEKKKVATESLNWLRNNDPETGALDDPTVRALAKLAGFPMPTPHKLSPTEKVIASIFQQQQPFQNL